MPYYTPEEIRKQVVTPLMDLVSEFNKLVGILENLQKSEPHLDKGVPLTPKSAIRGIVQLKKLKRQFNDKIEASQDGTLEIREKDRIRKAKERSRATPRKK